MSLEDDEALFEDLYGDDEKQEEKQDTVQKEVESTERKLLLLKQLLLLKMLVLLKWKPQLKVNQNLSHLHLHRQFQLVEM